MKEVLNLVRQEKSTEDKSDKIIAENAENEDV
jgi:hypothetical protein